MLLYQPPFLMVDNLMLFPDHEDPQAFYYIVSVPELALDNGELSFWGLAVLPDVSVDAAGDTVQDLSRVNLSFDVELTVTTEQLENAKKELAKQRGVEVKSLTPAPFQSGKTTLIVARPGDQQSKDITVFDGHSPSLLGANRAAFAVSAQEEEAKVLVASLAAGSIAATVGYELNFLGLTPSFEAKMTVHWQAVYNQFHQNDTTNFIFVSDQIEQTVEHLQESRAIEIEIKELDPEGASSATKALFDELKSQVVQKLFETPRPIGDEPIEDRIGHGVRNVLTALLPGVAHSLREMHQDELSDTIIDLHDQQSKSYPCFPQSTFSGMVKRAGGIKDKLQYVSLADLPFHVSDLVVEVAASAPELGVKAVNLLVEALSSDRNTTLLSQQVLLDVSKPGRTVLHYRPKGTGAPVIRFQAEMMLDPTTAPNGKERWPFDWKDVQGGRIWFDPEEFLTSTSVRFEVESGALFDLPASVMLDVGAYLGGDQLPFRSSHFDFAKDSLSQTFSVIVPDGADVVFKGKLTYRRPGEADYVVDGLTFNTPVYTIRNPFAKAWNMEVHSSADWNTTDGLVVEMRVWDPLRKVWVTGETKITKDAPVYTFRFFTSPDTPRDAQMRLSRITKDGNVIRGPWRDYSGAVVSISDQFQAARRIRVTLDAPRFTVDKVRAVSVELTYRAGDLNVDGNVLLTSDKAFGDWIHPFPDYSQPTYQFQVKARSTDGDSYSVKAQNCALDDLTVSLPANPWWS